MARSRSLTLPSMLRDELLRRLIGRANRTRLKGLKMSEKPWAYVAHKDGRWAGVCACDIHKKSLNEFLEEFAVDGFTLQPMANREEYLEFTAKMPPWR